MRRSIVALLVAVVGLSGCGSATVAVTPAKNSPTSLTTAAATPSAGASASSTAAGDAVTIALTGSLFWQDITWVSAKQDAEGDAATYNFSPMLEGVKSVLSDSALAVCHQEVPIAQSAQVASGFPSYAVPPEVVAAISGSGFDACTLNSAHTLDKGVSGVTTTVAAMRAGGILTAGAYKTRSEASTPVIATAAGVKVAIVSGTEFSGSVPADQAWVMDTLNAETMIAKAKAARAAGAQIVIAAMNAGANKTVKPTGTQTQIADALTKAPEIDLVFGHGSNVVQPITKVNGKWVLYGLGNLVAQPPSSQRSGFESVIAKATFTPSGAGYTVKSLDYYPTTTSVYSTGHPVRVQLTSQALAAGGDTAGLRESLERVTAAIGTTEGLTRR